VIVVPGGKQSQIPDFDWEFDNGSLVPRLEFNFVSLKSVCNVPHAEGGSSMEIPT
jgi:hypothetical protein